MLVGTLGLGDIIIHRTFALQAGWNFVDSQPSCQLFVDSRTPSSMVRNAHDNVAHKSLFHDRRIFWLYSRILKIWMRTSISYRKEPLRS